MSVDRAGFVARPLYVCTKCIYGDQPCMKVVPVHDSTFLRVPRLCMLVNSGGKTSIIRTKPYKVLLHALPPEWAWAKELCRPPSLGLAMLTPFKNRRVWIYKYNTKESAGSWLHSAAFEGKP